MSEQTPDTSTSSTTGGNVVADSDQGKATVERELPVRKILEAEPPSDKELECMAFLEENVKGKPLDDDTDFLNKTTFLRFARARDANKEKALSMLESCIAWRKEYKPHQITKEQVQQHLDLGTVWRQGVDKVGNPVLYLAPGASNPYNCFWRVQFVVWLLEHARKDGYDQLCWIFDWKWFAGRGREEQSTKTREKLQQVLQDYYPEYLGKLLFIDVPWYFSLLYTVASLFLAKRTKAKIHVVRGKQVQDHVDGDQLLDWYEGGKTQPCVKRMADDEVPKEVPDNCVPVPEYRTWEKVELQKPDN